MATMARQLRPDVVLMDVRMPRLDGISATNDVTTVCTVLILTTFAIYENAAFVSKCGRIRGLSSFLRLRIPTTRMGIRCRCSSLADIRPVRGRSGNALRWGPKPTFPPPGMIPRSS
ncbi:hypothetical protein Plo01_46160 [Planobispora longispora]|uniref:Response regulatory domain-containing protein n=1 Tax=Planobispora longispora TaxID=28887 RepID=A0A8J3RM38_9ACTN|nr:hypothetical protein GCM10020093_020880 [Planobispora longispora]GIH78187.1 hypothetical protein Plo01_46160 [Planobispora longispora]